MKGAARRIGLGLAALVLAAGAGSAWGNAAGMPDRAREGCGPAGLCHGGVLPSNLTTLLRLDGLPEGTYAPGCAYDLQVATLGVAVPARPYTTLPVAGFTLEVTGGRLDGDGSIVVWPETDCDVLARLEDCDPGTVADPCSRECDDVELRYWQASHAKREPNDATEMHRFLWDLRWTAPAAGAGPVTIYLAGGVGNGNSKADDGDAWSVAEPVLLEEGASGSCP